MVEGSVGSMWAPFKELSSLVEAAVLHQDTEVIPDLEVALRKHKPNFISLLKNVGRNSQDRQTLLSGVPEEIVLRGSITRQTVSQQILDEAIIVSDMYDLNEIVALDLLLAGEQQIPDHPCLTRGLVCVLLYYDGRKALVSSLRALIQARRGLTWTLGLSEEMTDLATTYTYQIMEEGLVDKILTLLSELDLSKELEKLQKNRALGGPWHRRQVLDLFHGIRQCLAEILFCWAAQAGLKKTEVLRLMAHLSRVRMEETASGGLDSITVTLLVALLYGLDVSSLQKREDGEDVIQKLVVVSDPTFIPAIHKELSPSSKKWETPALQAVVQFAWAMALSTLRSLPQNAAGQGYVDEDESLADAALDQKVFQFLSTAVLSNDVIFREEFYLRRLHNLVTDFIIQMPLKVKELRNRADEAARTILVYTQEGLEPPSHLPQHFEQLLHLVAKLYSQDPLRLELALEYWCPTEGATPSMYSFRIPQRQVSLYKFVRLAGDLLPPSLYVPYTNMLCSLSSTPQSAHHAFNLLKLNGTGQGSTVSWDHFFSSLNRYYNNLRKELPPSSDTMYRHHPLTKGITPQEVQGLQAVLRLIRAVAENDEYSRVALCENPAWMPLVIMLGLVGCAVPTPLKAELLRTLAAFARSPDIAHSLWQSVEVSQILATVPTTSSYRPRGIHTELEEVEARNEEYPLTLAFLHLLNALTTVSVPEMLGAGTRAPGFDPYLEFIQDSVFLRFNTRAYRKEEEKWDVAASCLQLLYKLLHEYEPSTQNNVDTVVELQGGGTTIVNKPPGYQLLVNLLHDSALLRMILYILDEGCRHLDQFTDVPGQRYLEQSTLLCLQLIRSAFSHQEAFLDLIRSQGSPLMVVSLDKLLLGMNPRSGKPDHMLNIARYITYHATLPSHALTAVQILSVVTASPASHPQLLAIFTASTDVATLIRHGFVECLENEEEEVREGDVEDEHASSKIGGATRLAILSLMLQCLDHPAPNIAHLLLGFDLHKTIHHSNLQQPGVLNSPRTCLHSLLAILDSGTDRSHVPTAVTKSPHLAELACRVLYCLCANNHTSDPVLRFLRSTPDFLTRHLSYLPFKGELNVHNLKQMSWLLKTIAIELKVMATNRQRSHLQRIISLLVESSDDQTSQTSELGTLWGDTTTTVLQLSWSSAVFTRSKPVRHRLMSLIDVLDFSAEEHVVPQWEYFDPSQIEQVMRGCEQLSDLGTRMVKVQQLHKLLHAELAALHGTAAISQRQLISQEIQNILLYAVKQNSVHERAAARRNYLDAWRHVTETLLTATPLEVLSRKERKQLLLELIQALLSKVLSDDTLPELANQVSGVVLIFLASLHHCYSLDAALSPLCGPQLDTGLGPLSEGQQLAVYSSALQVILKGLIEWMIKTGGAVQRVRANLYGALLNYLRIGHPSTNTVGEVSPGSSLGRRKRQLTSASEMEKHRQANVEVILSYGDSFLEAVCRDCCSGHDIGKMLALSCLDMLVAMDSRGHWITYLSKQGYLHHLIDSLLVEDDQLISLLCPQPESLRPLYVFETKMAMLTRCATTAAGAQLLLQNGVMGRLAEMKVFDIRPEMQYSSHPGAAEELLPPASQRYRQIFLLPLRLCQAIVMSLSVENKSATSQILHFLLAHGESVHTVLRSRLASLNLPALEELSLLTGVIARAASDDMTEDSLDMSVLEVQGQVMRLQHRMLVLIPHFILSDRLLRQVAALPETRGGRDIRAKTMIAVLQVACNLLLYAKNIVSRSGTNARYCRVLFGPSLLSALATDVYSSDEHESPVGITSKSPSLGVIVRQLRQTATFFHTSHSEREKICHKLALVQEMNSQELQEFLPVPASEKLTTAACRTLAAQRLQQLVTYKDQELEYCSLLVESAVFLLWRHLEYFLLYAVPPATPSLYQEAVRKRNEVPFEDEVCGPVTAGLVAASQDDIRKLKEDAVTIISDSLFQKIQEMEQYLKNRNHFGFVEALIRRIKRLVKLYTL